jgi:hypothetical protein
MRSKEYGQPIASARNRNDGDHEPLLGCLRARQEGRRTPQARIIARVVVCPLWTGSVPFHG